MKTVVWRKSEPRDKPDKKPPSWRPLLLRRTNGARNDADYFATGASKKGDRTTAKGWSAKGASKEAEE